MRLGSCYDWAGARVMGVMSSLLPLQLYRL